MRTPNSCRIVILIFFFGMCLSTGILHAQSPQHEIGLQMFNLRDFGLIYKRQKSENQYHRFRVARLVLDYNSAPGNEVFYTSGAFAYGLEKRVAISQRLRFLHGWEPGVIFNFINQNENNNLQVDLRVGYVLGLQYAISEQLLVSLETIPGIQFGFELDSIEEFNNYGLRGQFSSSLVALVFVYSFQIEPEQRESTRNW